MNIATWNVNSLNVRLPHVLQWLQAHQEVDVLALQELKLDHDKFPEAALMEQGYQAAWFGQKTYNGVALISKTPAQDIVCGIPEFDDEQKRVIAATFGQTRVINVYCVNGEAVGSDKFAYKAKWFAALTHYVAEALKQYPNLILLGDFNIAPADLDVYDPKAWHEKVLCSSEERSWFNQLLALGLNDSLRQLNPQEAQYTWWDYRMNMFKRKLGMRIDHILVSNPLIGSVQKVVVDTEARAWERPSDHAPVTAYLEKE
ncbi:exodeoxyribonuclease III [Neisseria sp. Ec49-e6-T10]|uniref:exodeoxyribonuclease III n=1 Tax=Neisseria sp. Ec49-e6-T10 TaxID=3140744 RepID=UPI003EBEF316